MLQLQLSKTSQYTLILQDKNTHLHMEDSCRDIKEITKPVQMEKEWKCLYVEGPEGTAEGL